MTEQEVEAAAGLLRHYRGVVKATEDDLARKIREAMAAGVSATSLAQAAGISRARVYQIKDGKR